MIPLLTLLAALFVDSLPQDHLPQRVAALGARFREPWWGVPLIVWEDGGRLERITTRKQLKQLALDLELPWGPEDVSPDDLSYTYHRLTADMNAGYTMDVWLVYRDHRGVPLAAIQAQLDLDRDDDVTFDVENETYLYLKGEPQNLAEKVKARITWFMGQIDIIDPWPIESDNEEMLFLSSLFPDRLLISDLQFEALEAIVDWEKKVLSSAKDTTYEEWRQVHTRTKEAIEKLPQPMNRSYQTISNHLQDSLGFFLSADEHDEWAYKLQNIGEEDRATSEDWREYLAIYDMEDEDFDSVEQAAEQENGFAYETRGEGWEADVSMMEALREILPCHTSLDGDDLMFFRDYIGIDGSTSDEFVLKAMHRRGRGLETLPDWSLKSDADYRYALGHGASALSALMDSGVLLPSTRWFEEHMGRPSWALQRRKTRKEIATGAKTRGVVAMHPQELEQLAAQAGVTRRGQVTPQRSQGL